jgi:hypothetical protein
MLNAENSEKESWRRGDSVEDLVEDARLFEASLMDDTKGGVDATHWTPNQSQ